MGSALELRLAPEEADARKFPCFFKKPSLTVEIHPFLPHPILSFLKS